MAASLAIRKLLSPSSSLRPSIRPLATRFFNTNALRELNDDVDEDRYRPSRRSDSVFSDVFDPFSPTRSLTQVLNMMDQFMENPYISAARSGIRRGWAARETDDALNLRIDMPGLDKEDVKVCVEQNTLIIKGEGKEDTESGDGEEGRRYGSRIDLPEKMYRTDQIKAEMKNGVLKLVVPKVKDEENADVFQVKVE